MRGLRNLGILLMGLSLIITVAACAPAATPTTAPTKAPPAAPPTAAAPTKAAEPTKPAAAASVAPAASPTAKLNTVKFGGTPTAGFAGIYLAIEKGYFKEQGIDLQLNDFRNIQEIIAPLGSGQLDVSSMPLNTALLTAMDRGVDMKLVAGGTVSRPGQEHAWVMLRKDLKDSGQIKTPADLKGMKVAILSVGSLSDQTIQTMLGQAGLKSGDAEIVVLSYPDQVAAFGNKGIAAGWITEPTITQAVAQGFAVKWVPISSYFSGQAPTTSVIYGPSLLKDRDLGQRWMTAYLKGNRDYLKALTTKQGWAEMVQAVIKYTTVKDPQLYEVMELAYMDPNGAIAKEGTESQYKWWVENGFYSGQKSLADITDASFAEYASRILGKQ